MMNKLNSLVTYKLINVGIKYLKNDLLTKLSSKTGKTFTVPIQFYWNITENCNYKCIMCPCWKSKIPVKDEIDYSDIDNIVKQISEFGIKKLGITGGEPLLRKDKVLKIIRAASSKGIWIHLVTNGSLLDESYAKELLHSGLNHISFSVDGIGHIHDDIRGVKGAFENVENAIRIINKIKDEENNNLIVKINTVVQTKNINNLIELYNFAKNNRTMIFFQPYNPFNKAIYADEDVKDIINNDSIFNSIRIDDVNKSLEMLIKIRRKDNSVIINTIEHLELLKYYYVDINKIRLNECYTGYKNFEITSTGDAFLCRFFNKPIGNIKESTIKQLWCSSEYDNQRRIMQKCKLPCMSGCRYYPSPITLFSDFVKYSYRK